MNKNSISIPTALQWPKSKRWQPQGAFYFHLAELTGKRRCSRAGTNKPGERTSVATVFKMLERNGSSVYGVRLDGLCVVDCDTRSPETLEIVRRRFPPSRFIVETSRGWHYYFRLADKRATFGYTIEQDGVKIDVKAGYLHQVVGPGSIRPDGKSTSGKGEPFSTIADLPVFSDS